jgi:hypothetical protein
MPEVPSRQYISKGAGVSALAGGGHDRTTRTELQYPLMVICSCPAAPTAWAATLKNDPSTTSTSEPSSERPRVIADGIAPALFRPENPYAAATYARACFGFASEVVHTVEAVTHVGAPRLPAPRPQLRRRGAT